MNKIYTNNMSRFCKITVISFAAVFISTLGFAQLTVSTAMTPQQLVQNVLVGTGVTVSNITYSGVNGSIGRFTTGTNPTNLGFSSGIIMSTGLVNGIPAIGSPAAQFASNNNNGGSDPQLQSLVPSNTIYDASVLQFDFVPLSDTIKFRYVFGSEEYPEFVNTSYNDVFGFFVTGPNPAGGSFNNYNIARIPNTATPVSINNVNNGTANAGPCTNCAYYVNNASGTTIVYDGFTTILTAWCRVVPCMTYHLKLAIGDAGDHIYDSGVFLEANSFSAPSVTINTSFSSPAVSTTTAVEGCNNAILTFSLPNIQTIPYGISYAIAGTATNGIDYTAIPNSILIPAGQSSVNLVIAPIMDGIVESTETVILIVQTNICGGIPDTVKVNILNNNPLTAISSNDTMICGGAASIWVQPSGGITPYTYLWDNGAGTSPSASVSPTTNTTYNVTVTDLCGSTVTENVNISIGGTFANAGPDVAICLGQNTTLTASGGSVFLWSTGATTASITVSPATTTTYFVTVTAACESVDSVTVTVNPLPNITATSTPSSILLGSSSDICALGGSTYSWTSNPPDATLTGQETNPCATVLPTVTTNYIVVGTDSNGCQNTASTMVTILLIVPEVDFWGDPLSGCVPLQVNFYDNSTSTSTGSTYYWDFGNGTFSYDQNPVAYYDHHGSYSVSLRVVNPGGGAATLQKTDYVTSYPNPIAMFSSTPENSTTILYPYFHFYDNSLFSPTEWYWDFGDGNNSNLQNSYHNFSEDNYYYQLPFMEDTGTYTVTLIVTTEYGCKDSASKSLRIEPAFSLIVPNAFTPNGDAINQDFCVKSFGVLRENYSIIIFNRWGQQVFYSNDLEECWNGNTNNVKSEIGTYVYKINFLDTQRIKHQKNGTVTIVR